MNFVSSIIWNSVEGFVEAGTRTAGGYAGDALIKAGDMIENSGRGVGNKLERTASGYGGKISGQPVGTGGKAQSSAARRTALTRSNSSPAVTKSGAGRGRGGGSNVPLGGNKYPGGYKAAGANKQITSGARSNVGGAKSSVGGIAGRPVGGAGGGAQKASGGGLPKPYPQKGAANSNNLPKPNPSNNYPTEKKSAVRPGGRPEPFVPPPENNQQKKSGGPGQGGAKYPGAGSGVPVQQQKRYKPMPRMEGTAEKGKMQHIAV